MGIAGGDDILLRTCSSNLKENFSPESSVASTGGRLDEFSCGSPFPLKLSLAGEDVFLSTAARSSTSGDCDCGDDSEQQLLRASGVPFFNGMPLRRLLRDFIFVSILIHSGPITTVSLLLWRSVCYSEREVCYTELGCTFISGLTHKLQHLST